MIGIYKIINIINNKIYIGSSVNLFKRKNSHFGKLNKGNHPNIHLQNSFNKYTKNNFVFEIVEELNNVEDLLKREQYYIDLLKPEYNKRLIVNSNLGIKFSEEAKRNMSIAMTGNKNNFYGRNHSEESKNKMKLDKLGKKSRKTIFPGKSISKYTLEGDFIENYKTLKEAAYNNNFNYKWFIEVIKKNNNYKGFLWIIENKQNGTKI